MGLGRQAAVQSDLLLSWSELPRSPGDPFDDRLQEALRGAGFDRHVEDLCRPHDSAEARGRKSLPPDHSWLSRTRSRLPAEVHDRVFAWVLQLPTEHGLIKGERIGVDASTMEANAALRSIVRRDTGEGYREMLKRLAAESGIETPTADNLIRLDRKRPGKKLSNEDWQSPTDSDARIARMKDGRTRLAYKPEHSLDLDTGAVFAAPVHHADRGDTKTLPETLEETTENLAAVALAPIGEEPTELVADKGYHGRDGLKELHDST